jgi:hypothetical protein
MNNLSKKLEATMRVNRSIRVNILLARLREEA